MSEQMEELIEDLAAVLSEKVPYDARKMAAKSFITRILQAVADGDLDEALGVVGRWILQGEYEDIMGLCGGDILIALSPFPRDPPGTGIPAERKEGTGKEEEK